jgi:hypothetical protein
MAFNTDVAGEKFLSIDVLNDWFVDFSVGSNLYVIPLNDTGRKPKNYPLLHAHLTIIVLDPKAYWLAIGAASHSSNRESVITWLGASNRFFTSGFYLVIFINKRNLFIVCVFIYSVWIFVVHF